MIDTFETCFAQLAEASAEEIDDTIHQMAEDQPALLAYLLAVGEDFLGDGEIETLLFLGVVIRQAMQAELGPARRVKDSEVDKAESRNLKLIDRLATVEVEDLATEVEAVVSGSPHQETLLFLSEMVADPDFEISKPHQGIVLICLKTFLDALSQGHV